MLRADPVEGKRVFQAEKRIVWRHRIQDTNLRDVSGEPRGDWFAEHRLRSCNAVIDLHAHILPGVDDGPPSFEQSLGMLRMAVQAGTMAIVATPHFSRKHPLRPALVQRRWEELQHLAGDTIRVYRGYEVELTGEAVRTVLAAPVRFTICGYHYLLAEVPDDARPEEAEPLLDELLGAGLRVILAHPEAHPSLGQSRRRLERWVQRGVFLQASAGSLLGLYGHAVAEAAHKLVKFGLVHFIASNAHDLRYRPPRLDVIRLQLTALYPPEFLEQLLEFHPRAVVQGQELPPGPLEAPWLRRHWYEVWR
jgi:protein-tyrosine phosphatase